MITNQRRFSIFMLLLLLISVFPVSGCTAPADETKSVEAGFIDITSANETYAIILENAENESFVILDVRTPEEYQEGHLPEAVNLDFKSDSFRDVISLFDKDREYLVYCQSGKRSTGAVEVMRELGFQTVYHLTGGFSSWKNAGLPMAK